MSIVEFDSQKIEQLLHSATSERQRKMYQALLNKARSQECSSTDSSASRIDPSTEKKVRNGSQTLTKEKKETKKKTQTVKKNQKANPISVTTEASTSKKQSLTKEKSETKKKTQTVKKNKKANRQSASTKASISKKQSTKAATKSSKLTPDSSAQTPSRQGLDNEVKDFGQNSPLQDYKPNPSEKKEDRLSTSRKTPEAKLSAIDERGKGASKHKDLTRDTNKTIDQAPFSPRAADRRKGTREFDVASQTELKSQSPKPEKPQPDAEPTMFQAVGALIATPSLQDNLLTVAINGREYDLFYVQGFRRQAHTRLKAELEKNGSSPMFLRLYPNAKFSKSLEKPLLSFLLVNFNRDCEKINDEPVGFVLRGIWQYITQCESPVISIYRNYCPPQLEFFKKLNSQQQVYFTQPHHIPVVWDTTIEPFKFNPQAKKDSQMPRYFVEVRATFKDAVYVVEEMLSEPTLKIPKFIKVSTPRLDGLEKPQLPSRSKNKPPKPVKKKATKSES